MKKLLLALALLWALPAHADILISQPNGTNAVVSATPQGASPTTPQTLNVSCPTCTASVPGGSAGQIQYNNGGTTFGGDSGFTTNGTGNLTNSGNGAASTPSLLLNGTLFTGGSGTTTFPQILVQPTGTTAATTWNTGGTIFGVNAVSGFTGSFLDLNVAGTEVFRISSAGTITVVNNSAVIGLRNGGTLLSSPVNGSLQNGGFDADTNAAIVAQTIRSQGALAGGTADQAGKNWTFIASPGKGTGAGGSFIFQTAPAGSTGTAVNAPVTALTIDSTKLATFAGQISVTAMTQTSAAQSGTVCYNSGTGAVTYDATLGCLTSIASSKTNIIPISSKQALSEVVALRPVSFKYRDGLGLPSDEQVGLIADEVANIDERIVGRGPDGELRGVRYAQSTAVLIGAIQQLKADNDNLRAELTKIKVVIRRRR